MSQPIVEELPPTAPRKHGPLLRGFARLLLRLFGWRLEGAFPDHKRLLVIVAPHSSAWDALYGLIIKVALGMDARFMAKREAFWWPLGWLLRTLGGVPIDRRAAHGVVEATVDALKAEENVWFMLAPEGTRRAVTRWKTGFWHIARQADVPVCLVYIHYPEKKFGIGECWRMTDDMEADLARIRAWYAPFVGKNRGV